MICVWSWQLHSTRASLLHQVGAPQLHSRSVVGAGRWLASLLAAMAFPSVLGASLPWLRFGFLFRDPATAVMYPVSLHFALPVSASRVGLIQALGAEVRVHIHRPVKNTDDQHLVLSWLLVIDHMRPVRKLSVAFSDLVARPSHQGVLRKRAKNLIHLLQVRIALPYAPLALRKLRNRL